MNTGGGGGTDRSFKYMSGHAPLNIFITKCPSLLTFIMTIDGKCKTN